jgi:type IV pilus assembly protein PilC
VKAGEASGKLDMILSRYAAYTEQQLELRQKITGALFYPFLLVLAGIGVTLFIVTTIIPQFAAIFLKVGIQLPLPTFVLYQVGMGIKQFWHSLILLGIILYTAFGYYISTPFGRLQWDRLILQSPLFGPLFRKVAIARFSRTFGMLVESGVPILQSLDIVREVIGNEVLARVVENTHNAVEKGERISEPLKISGDFPYDMIQMVAIGEETGHLDQMLEKVADFYERSVGHAVKKLTTLIEPLLLVVLGGLVGLIMASLLLPMFDMMKMLRLGRGGF